MLSVLSEVLPFAIGVAASAAAVIALVLILQGSHAMSSGLAYTLGWVLGVGLVCAFGITFGLAVADDPASWTLWLKTLLGALLLVAAVPALSLGLAFALPGHIELIAVIFVANLPLLFASTALAPISFMPSWLGWLAALNPLTFAIEPIRAAYLGQFSLNAVVLEAPYGSLTAAQCLSALLILSAALFVSIRPLLDRKLS